MNVRWNDNMPAGSDTCHLQGRSTSHHGLANGMHYSEYEECAVQKLGLGQRVNVAGREGKTGTLRSSDGDSTNSRQATGEEGFREHYSCVLLQQHYFEVCTYCCNSNLYVLLQQQHCTCCSHSQPRAQTAKTLHLARKYGTHVQLTPPVLV